MIQAIAPEATFDLVRKGGGVFEIERDGAMLFSKKASGRFPDETEIKGFAE